MTEKIKLDKPIPTDSSEEKFAKYLSEKKTYFLNGTWGSGKTKFINNVEERLKDKKFIYLDLWNIKDDRTVIKIAFEKFFGTKKYFGLRFLVVFCIVISILTTNLVNLGIEKWLNSHQLSLVVIFSGFIALIVAVFQFLKIRSDSFYINLFKGKFFKLFIKNKVLILDDFDRVSISKQEEAYKLFNILKGEIPILFMGDYTKIAKNDYNFLQKIIDRQFELPLSITPPKIWGDYFKLLEENFKFEVDKSLIEFFISENRNLRDRVHFNDYVNIEFIDNNKFDHVQPNQQLLVIYLYLFHKDNYHKLLTSGLPKYTVQEAGENVDPNIKDFFRDSDSVKKFDSKIEALTYQILNADGYYSYKDNSEGYFILENISNLSISEGEEILANEEKLKDNILNNGSIEDDFYKFVEDKYGREWPSLDRENLIIAHIDGKDMRTPDSIKNIEKVAFDMLKENRNSTLIYFIIRQMIIHDPRINNFNDYSSEVYANDIEQAKIVVNKFENGYLKNFDISQKIHFFTTFSFEMKSKAIYQVIYERYVEQVTEILNDEEQYQLQKRKPYLLLMASSDDSKNWKSIELWSDTVKKILKNSISEVDFMKFLELYRIIEIDSKKFSKMPFDSDLSAIQSVEIYDGFFKQELSDGINKTDNELLDHIKIQIKTISDSERFDVNVRIVNDEEQLIKTYKQWIYDDNQN